MICSCTVLLVSITIALLLLLRWILSPYFKWRANKKDSSNENIVVLINDKKYSYNEYLSKIAPKSLDLLDLSIVVPAYNEQDRLPVMLKETTEYFEKESLVKYNYEIIVINDGSKDKTTQVALDFQKSNPNINLKVIEYDFNKGKGGAIRIGMLTAVGNYLLMADADAATDIHDFKKVFDELKKIENNGLAIAAGSRNHLVKDVVTKRKFYRNILMYCSNFVVNKICGVKLRDTQCGFKLFTKATSQLLFNALHLERWAFDVELFIMANYHKIPVCEVPVNWQDVEGSKLNVVTASLMMARDYLLVKILYTLKVWKVDDAYAMPKK